MPAPEITGDVRHVIWNFRQLDLLGQMLLLLSGVFGSVILIKEMKNKNG